MGPTNSPEWGLQLAMTSNALILRNHINVWIRYNNSLNSCFVSGSDGAICLLLKDIIVSRIFFYTVTFFMFTDISVFIFVVSGDILSLIPIVKYI